MKVSKEELKSYISGHPIDFRTGTECDRITRATLQRLGYINKGAGRNAVSDALDVPGVKEKVLKNAKL